MSIFLVRCLRCAQLGVMLAWGLLAGGQMLVPATETNAAAAEETTPPLVVQYQDGLLTIRARNASLRSILEEVRAKTGAEVENSGAGEDRGNVVADFGPGEPSVVIAELLYGTAWNYAVLSSPDLPGKLARIVLMPKRAAAPEMARTAPPPAMIAPAAASATTAEGEQIEDAEENSGKDETASDEKAKDEKSEDEVAKDEAGGDAKKTAKKDGEKPEDEAAEQAAADPGPNSTPVFPDGLYRMYPSLFGNRGGQGGMSGDSGGMTVVPTGDGGNMPSLYSAMGGRGGTGVQADVAAEAPVVPREFPEALWKMYPPNLLDLIKNSPVPPPPPPAPYVPPGTGVLWDQGITVAR